MRTPPPLAAPRLSFPSPPRRAFLLTGGRGVCGSRAARQSSKNGTPEKMSPRAPADASMQLIPNTCFWQLLAHPCLCPTSLAFDPHGGH